MVKYKRLKLLLLSTLLFNPVIASASSLASAPINSFSVTAVDSNRSPDFMKTVKPGAKFKVKVKVNNISNKAKEFTIYPTDVLPDLRGGWTYPLKDVKPKLIGTWIKEEPRSKILKAGASTEYTFDVEVPKDVKPGQYIAAIVSQEFTPAAQVKSDSGMSTVSDANMQLPMQVIMNVDISKATHSLDIGDIHHTVKNNGLLTIFIPHVNKGTILEKPTGKFTLKDSNNKVLFREEYSMDSVYVQTTGLYDLDIPDMLIPGKYSLDYETNYQQETLRGTYDFEVSTSDLMSAMDKADNVGNKFDLGFWSFLKEFWIWIVAVILIIILLMIIIIILLLRRRRKEDEKENT